MRRKLNDALDFGRRLQATHDLQTISGDAAPDDLVAILDVSEVEADAQPKKITLSDLVSAAGASGATGPEGAVQTNSGGSLAGFVDFVWNQITKVLNIKGDIQLDDGGTYTTTIQTVTPTANRTISFPDLTGTVGLVAGSNGQVTYNNAGAQAGDANLTWNATTGLALGKPLNVNIAGAASTPSVSFLGTWFTGGTSTTTKPKLLIEPAGATSTAWSTSGTGLGVNAASGFTGNLLDLQLNGTSKYAFGVGALTFGDAVDLAFNTTTGTKIGTATTQKLGFFGVTPVVQQTELTDELTTITHTAPGTPDYAIQNLTDTGGFGFASADEGNTVLSVIANLQTRVNELETKLVALGLLADAD